MKLHHSQCSDVGGRLWLALLYHVASARRKFALGLARIDQSPGISPDLGGSLLYARTTTKVVLVGRRGKYDRRVVGGLCIILVNGRQLATTAT